MLEIITITKDDYVGIQKTVSSTKDLRLCQGVLQTVIDGSQKTLGKKIEDLIAGEVNIRYVRQESCGIASAFNLGLSTCRSEWVWFLNGGDEVYPEADTELLIKLLGKARSDVIIFDIEMMQSGIKSSHPPIWALWPPLYGNWVPHPATIMRTKLFQQYGLFDSKYKIAMDADVWMRFFSKNILVDMLSIPISLYDENGMSSRSCIETGREAKRILLGNYFMLIRMWLARGIHLFKALKHYILLTRSI